MRTTTIASVYLSLSEFTSTKTSECWFVAVTMIAVWLLCLCVYAMKPVESSHFMGGVIQWRPLNPAAFDGRVSKIILMSSPVLVCMSLCLIWVVADQLEYNDNKSETVFLTCTNNIIIQCKSRIPSVSGSIISVSKNTVFSKHSMELRAETWQSGMISYCIVYIIQYFAIGQHHRIQCKVMHYIW